MWQKALNQPSAPTAGSDPSDAQSRRAASSERWKLRIYEMWGRLSRYANASASVGQEDARVLHRALQRSQTRQQPNICRHTRQGVGTQVPIWRGW